MSETAAVPASSPLRGRLSRATIPLLLVGLAGVLLVLYAWRLPPFRTTIESTDNAYVRGGVTVIAPKLDGYVTATAVQDFQTVQAGQVLVTLDDRIYRQKLDQAKATLASQEAALANSRQSHASAEAGVRVADAQIANARATLTRTSADLKRYEALAAEGWVSQQQVEQSRAAQDQARAALAQMQASRASATENVTTVEVNRGSLEAAVESARAAVELAEIDLQNTRVTAPRAGRLGEVGVRLGQYVTPGSQLMSMAPEGVWVIANFKETQMAKIRPGQPATLRVDALGGARLKGRVERIAPATGSEFSVLRPENATGNFTKIVQRIPVRIALDPGQPLTDRLSPGMSVIASVDTKGAR